MKAPLHSWEDIGTTPTGGAFIDYASALASSAWILESGDFAIADFHELCNLLEAIVLYDCLYVTPNPQPPPGYEVPVNSDFVSGLISEGILKLVTFPWHKDDDRKNKGLGAAYERIHRGRRTDEGIEEVEHFIGAGVSVLRGMHLHPSCFNRQAYLTGLKVAPSLQATSLLLDAYRGTASEFIAAAKELQSLRGATWIAIPPIPALILSKASHPSGILDIVLELREEMRTCRRAMAEYAAVIADEEAPIGRSLKALKFLQQVMAELSAPFPSSEKRVLLEWKDIIDIVPENCDLDADDVKGLVGLVVGKPLKWLIARLRRRKFLFLYSMRRRAFSVANPGASINNVWGVSITPAMTRQSAAYLVTPDQARTAREPDVIVPKPSGYETYSEIWD